MTTGGSLVGISSPGCSNNYRPQPGYDMPGSGKCIMEYSMRYVASEASELFEHPQGPPGTLRTPAGTTTGRIMSALNVHFLCSSLEEQREKKFKVLAALAIRPVVARCSNTRRGNHKTFSNCTLCDRWRRVAQRHTVNLEAKRAVIALIANSLRQ